MTNRMAVMLGAWALADLAACDDPTRPADAPATSPAPAVAAVEPQFTVRNLGTLGDNESNALGINEQGEVVGNAELASRLSRSLGRFASSG